MYAPDGPTALEAARAALQAELDKAAADDEDARPPFELCQHPNHIAVMTVKKGEPFAWVVWAVMVNTNEAVFHLEGPTMVTRNGLPNTDALIDLIHSLT